MFGFATSITWLRRTLRPGMLWMLVNPDDPNYDPVNEIVSRSLARHARRLVASVVLYLCVLLSVSLLPALLLTHTGVAPLRVHDVFKLRHSSELVALNLLLPFVLRHVPMHIPLSRVALAYLRVVAAAFDLQTYFFGGLLSAHAVPQPAPANVAGGAAGDAAARAPNGVVAADDDVPALVEVDAGDDYELVPGGAVMVSARA
jgi:hypothetical protein